MSEKMSLGDAGIDDSSLLRKKAETILDSEPMETHAAENEDETALQHELRVHQIELELQNEELRQRQIDLEMSHHRYFLHYELSPICQLRVLSNGSIAGGNFAASDLLGIFRSDLNRGKVSFLTLLSPADRPLFSHWMDVAAQKKEPSDIVATLIPRGEKEPRHVSIRIAMLDQKSGDCEYALAITDITVIKKLESELNRERKQLKEILDTVPQLISFVDDKLVYRFASKAYELFFNKNTSDLVGKSMPDIIGPEAWRATKHHIEQALEGNKVVYQEKIRYRNQGVRDMMVVLIPRFNFQGKVDGYFSVLSEVTDLVQKEMALRESERRFLDVTSAAGEYVWETDREGKLIFLTELAERIFGKPKQALLGQRLVDLVSPEDYQKVAEPLASWKNAPNGFRNVEMRTQHPEGILFWQRLSAVPIYDESNQCLGYRGTGLDITESKRAAEELERTKQEAEAAAVEARAADRAKSEFLAMMSHEIRTPMNSVLGFAQLLKTTAKLTPNQIEYTNIIERSGNALLVLINDILDISRIEAGKLDMQANPVRLSDLVGEVCGLLKPKAEEKKILFRWENPYPLPASVRIDSHRLRQVLVNLLGNALKFTNEGEVLLTVTSHPLEEKNDFLRVCFAVKDTGIGIAAEELKHLFKPFSQVDSSSTRRYGGTGLGLLISQRLCQAMGGGISVESKQGKGSTFTAFIDAQLTDEEPAASIHKSFRPTMKPSRQIHALVIDDDAHSRYLMEQVLASCGVTCVLAEDGLSGMKLAHESLFDVAFIDLEMPGLSGFDVVKALSRELPEKRLPTLVCVSAHALNGVEEKCRAVGAQEYLAKPFALSSIQDILERCQTDDQSMPQSDPT